jgi:hypothetical protein
VDFSRLNGKRIAIVFQGTEAPFVVKGTATYELDPNAGNFIRVPLQEGGTVEEGEPHVIVYEKAGHFTNAGAKKHGCDYCVIVNVSPPKPPTDTKPKPRRDN